MLELQNLSKKYRDNDVIVNISTVFNTGITAILGANGVGKSTLLNMIATSLDLDSGQILYNKKNIQKEIAEYRNRLGFVPQSPPYYPFYTGHQFLEYICLLKQIPNQLIKSEISRVLGIVRMTEHAKKKIKNYSGGMKQRISIAQALLGDPEILILDEPTVGLDPKERMIFIEYIKEASVTKTILFSTHVVSDIEEISNNILLLKGSSILYKGTVSEIIDEHKKKFPDTKTLSDIFLHIYD
ncbi:ABC transporter ATP-binding protein [Paenibacillus sp. 598K]|uniref:ABC transporter ATP-binding protein n=1 Tax=Paenibacillus sp. 598K TaxID=1117987 RepID=UPI000FFA7E2F|nr:ATP-binding cassette domain-containing protein [Paenibacillus sp. 598K]GBF78486.1 ABC transporter ATP-binding protein [Paenibacillus sp. 598K]